VSDSRSDARPHDDDAAEARRVRRLRRRKTLKVLSLAFAGALAVAFVGGYLVYRHFNGNITAERLYSGTEKSDLAEKPDAFGRTPLNILVIGSDSRATAADCAIGGDCSDGSGANADVEMVVHLAADRSNATVMSIPRDLVTNLPACTDAEDQTSFAGGYDMINSALAYGPGCSVAAVQQLTGIPIDHFAMLDFSGVVNMSDAIGGVDVCVDNDVYDPYSHLKLAKGTHSLQGLAALEFLRTRHGFGDGSDLGRTYAQHIFITQMVDKLKSAGTLTDPFKVLDLANAATKALTVDTGLDSITKLVGLAEDLSKVPADRITFTTMQNTTDPNDANRVVIGPGAQELFAAIINDQSLTDENGNTPAQASPSPTPKPSPTPPAPTPAAGALPATPVDQAVEARRLGGTDSPAPADTAAALNGSHDQTGNQIGMCAPVSDQLTVQINGVSMTPVQAYAASPNVPDSAP